MDIKKILFRTNSIDVEKALPDAIIMCSKDGKIQWVNDIAAEILNIAYQSLDSKGDNDSEFILPIMELTKQGLTPGDIQYETGKVVNG